MAFGTKRIIANDENVVLESIIESINEINIIQNSISRFFVIFFLQISIIFLKYRVKTRVSSAGNIRRFARVFCV